MPKHFIVTYALKTYLVDSFFSLQSLFGKNLITILNEYVAVKSKGEYKDCYRIQVKSHD